MKKLLPAIFIIISTGLTAQEKVKADTNAVKTIDGIVKEALRLICVSDGKTHNLEAFRNLFLPTATFTILNHGESFPRPVETVSLDYLINLMDDPYYKKGYIEKEIHKVVDEYNGIAQVFQTNYAKDSENQEERAINSYQLVFFNNRWWIVNILWTGNSNGVDIPAKYLGK